MEDVSSEETPWEEKERGGIFALGNALSAFTTLDEKVPSIRSNKKKYIMTKEDQAPPERE